MLSTLSRGGWSCCPLCMPNAMKQSAAPHQRSIWKPPNSCLQKRSHSDSLAGGVRAFGPSVASRRAALSLESPPTWSACTLAHSSASGTLCTSSSSSLLSDARCFLSTRRQGFCLGLLTSTGGAGGGCGCACACGCAVAGRVGTLGAAARTALGKSESFNVRLPVESYTWWRMDSFEYKNLIVSIIPKGCFLIRAQVQVQLDAFV